MAFDRTWDPSRQSRLLWQLRAYCAQVPLAQVLRSTASRVRQICSSQSASIELKQSIALRKPAR